LTDINFDPEAKAPLWETFLDEIMLGDVELIGFLRRAVGYALTGDVSEQVWLFLHGKGSNGKSTFLRVILRLLGEYGMQAAPELLLAKKGEAHPTEIADLAGKRLAVCTEIEQGRALAEVQVKQLTGGDRVKARFMRQDFFEFEPTHKIFLAANHRPIIRGTDYAIWRRIHLVPFNATFKEDQQDKGLLSKLLAELPGILAWAVRGCSEWQIAGLQPPAAVVAATRSYREDQDVFADFLADRCVLGPERSCSAESLYQAFVGWCQATGETSFSQKTFGGLLSDRGFDRAKHGSGRRWYWFGIDVVNPLNPLNPSSRLTTDSHADGSTGVDRVEHVTVRSTGNDGSMGSMGSPHPGDAHLSGASAVSDPNEEIEV
jgi:putative DNA primase/helicase